MITTYPHRVGRRPLKPLLTPSRALRYDSDPVRRMIAAGLDDVHLLRVDDRGHPRAALEAVPPAVAGSPQPRARRSRVRWWLRRR